jgi:hypothetical protein
MNKPLPRSRFGKKYSNNYDRIFSLKGMGSEVAPILYVKTLDDLPDISERSDCLHMAYVEEGCVYYIWDHKTREWVKQLS